MICIKYWALGEALPHGVQGLHHAGLLEEPLARLVSDLKQHFFEPLLSKSCKLDMSEASLTLVHLDSNTRTFDPCLVFSQLRELLSFLSVRLDCVLDTSSQESKSSTLLSAMSPLLSPWLCEQLVKQVLAPGSLSIIINWCNSQLSGLYFAVLEYHQLIVDYICLLGDCK